MGNKEIKEIEKIKKFLSNDFTIINNYDIIYYQWAICCNYDINKKNKSFFKGDVVIVKELKTSKIIYHPEFEEMWNNIIKLINRKYKIERILK
jgi:hypothetical protein